MSKESQENNDVNKKTDQKNDKNSIKSIKEKCKSILNRIEKNHNSFLVLTSIALAGATFFLALFAGVQTYETKRMVLETKNIIKTTERQIEIANEDLKINQEQLKLNKRLIEIIMRNFFPKIQLILFMKTNLDYAQIIDNDRFEFNSTQWNKPGSNADFEIKIKNMGSNIINRRVEIEYICYAFEDIEDKDFSRRVVRDTVSIPAVPGAVKSYNITNKIFLAIGLLQSNFKLGIPDNIRMEIKVGRIKDMENSQEIRREVDYVIDYSIGGI